uniref:non-specific serine/threonine protein kinase n=1 Tax=Arcella intermedia TaxID=1963864 RepID=A0A6B2KYW5_9EUKA
MIGRGGFATIYKAYDKESKRVFAVKKVDFQCLSETEKLQLLVRELLVLHITNHPNLVKMEDAYLHSENLDIVLEYCGFGSLSDLTKGRPLSEEQSIYCLWNTLQGLSVLHSIGICHRDIKGSNILITSEGEVKLSDFGTAARVLPLSRRKTFVGTPYWMPPEVAKSGVSSSLVGYGLSADVWSIGITAIELLMGKPPNSDMLPMSLIYKLASMNTPVPTIPEYLCSDLYNDFVMKCLCNDPDARPSVEDLKDHPVFNEIRKGNPLQSPLLKIERPIKKDQTESKIETIHTLNTLPCDTSDNYWSNWSVTDVASTVDILAAQSGPPRALDVKDSHVSAFIKNAMGEVRGLQRKHQKEQRELTKKCSKQIENTLKNYERWISEGRKMKLAQIQTTIAADTDRLVYIIRAFENPSFVLERKRRKIINKINEFCEFQQPNVLEELKTLYEQIQRRETDFYKEIHVIENNLFALQHKLLIQHLKDMQNEIVANQKKKIDNMYQVLQKFSNETKTLENKDLLLTRAMDHADREFEELKKFQNHEKRDLDDEIAKAKAILDNLHKETERFLKLKEDKLKNVVDTRTSQLNLIETLIDKIIQYSRLHNLEVPFRKGGVCDFSEIFRNEAKHQFEICKLSHRYQKLIDDQKEASERMGRAAAECRSCVYLNELFGIMVSATRKEESDFDIDT